jgi:HSP20 family molecular chaperone IbpA
VDQADVTVELSGNRLTVAGLRRGRPGSNAWTFSHGEIPRGPFHRTFEIPFPIETEPRTDMDRGLLRVLLRRAHGEGSETNGLAAGNETGGRGP